MVHPNKFSSSHTLTMERTVPVEMEIYGPLSMQVLKDPVMCTDGHVYERAMIETWLRTHTTSPLTRANVAPVVFPLRGLRLAIDRLAREDVSVAMERYGWTPTVEMVVDPEMMDLLVDHHEIRLTNFSKQEMVRIVQEAPERMLRWIIDLEANREGGIFGWCEGFYVGLFEMLGFHFRFPTLFYMIETYPDPRPNLTPIVGFYTGTCLPVEQIRPFIQFMVESGIDDADLCIAMLRYLVKMREPELIRQFYGLREEPRNEYPDGTGTPLMVACQTGYLEGMELLIELGDSVDDIDGVNCQPIDHLFGKHSTPEMFDLLLENGAKINQWEPVFRQCTKRVQKHLLTKYDPTDLCRVNNEESIRSLVETVFSAGDMEIIRLLPVKLVRQADRGNPGQLFNLAAVGNHYKLARYCASLGLPPTGTECLDRLCQHKQPSIRLANLCLRLGIKPTRLTLLGAVIETNDRMIFWILDHRGGRTKTPDALVDRITKVYTGPVECRARINKRVYQVNRSRARRNRIRRNRHTRLNQNQAGEADTAGTSAATVTAHQ